MSMKRVVMEISSPLKCPYRCLGINHWLCYHPKNKECESIQCNDWVVFKDDCPLEDVEL